MSKIKKVKGNIIPQEDPIITEKRTLGKTEIKYKLLRFGKTSFLGQLPQGRYISIQFKDNFYIGTIHSTEIGRIDSLTRLYENENLKQGDIIKAEYFPERNSIKISLMKKL